MRHRAARHFLNAERVRSAEHSLSQPDSSFIGNIDLRLRLDLIEIRQRLIALRSLHSHDQRITSPINRLIAQIGHLKEPESCSHEKALRDRIALTFAAVDKIASGKPRDDYTRSRS